MPGLLIIFKLGGKAKQAAGTPFSWCQCFVILSEKLGFAPIKARENPQPLALCDSPENATEGKHCLGSFLK